MHIHHISYDVPDWNQGCYRDKAPVLAAARPWRMVHPEKSDIAVVLATGYAGYPGELVRPGVDLFDRGYDVFCPRQSGCGTSGADFQKTGREDWVKSVDNCLKDVRSRYQVVYLVGHSMGGLTAIKLAHAYRITRLVLLAPSLDMYMFQQPEFLEKVKAMQGPEKIEWHQDPSYHLHYENAPADDPRLGAEYWSWIYPKQLLELKALCDEAIQVLPELKANTRLIAAGRDVLVTPHSQEIFKEKKTLGYNEVVVIPNATHFMIYDPDPEAEQQAVDNVLSWFDA